MIIHGLVTYDQPRSTKVLDGLTPRWTPSSSAGWLLDRAAPHVPRWCASCCWPCDGAGMMGFLMSAKRAKNPMEKFGRNYDLWVSGTMILRFPKPKRWFLPNWSPSIESFGHFAGTMIYVMEVLEMWGTKSCKLQLAGCHKIQCFWNLSWFSPFKLLCWDTPHKISHQNLMKSTWFPHFCWS